jgi:hypothetical protein
MRLSNETIFQSPRSRPETEINLGSCHCSSGDSAMWDFINNLYRDYCLARVQEIRKYELSH